MSKTKEEIVREEYNKKFGSPKYDDSVNRKMNLEYFGPAMDEHAKNQAIDFAEWVDGKMYECFLHTDEGIKHWHDMNEKGNLTTEQLYALFLQSQSQ